MISVRIIHAYLQSIVMLLLSYVYNVLYTYDELPESNSNIIVTYLHCLINSRNVKKNQNSHFKMFQHSLMYTRLQESYQIFNYVNR